MGFRESRARKGMVGERASEGWSDEGKRGEGELCNLGKERERERMSHRAAYSTLPTAASERFGPLLRSGMGLATTELPYISKRCRSLK